MILPRPDTPQHDTTDTRTIFWALSLLTLVCCLPRGEYRDKRDEARRAGGIIDKCDALSSYLDGVRSTPPPACRPNSITLHNCWLGTRIKFAFPPLLRPMLPPLLA